MSENMNTEEPITDKDIAEKFESWLDHYKKAGDKHSRNESTERIIELYYDRIVERVLEDYHEDVHETVLQAIHGLF